MPALSYGHPGLTLLLLAPTLAAQTLPAPSALVIPDKISVPLGPTTTILTTPLLSSGAPNYVQALNDRYGKGVTPANNGFALWLQIVGTDNTVIPPKIHDKLLTLAGATDPPPDADLLESWDRFLEKRMVSQADRTGAVGDQITTFTTRLWTAADAPELAAYLAKENKNLDRVVTAANLPHWWIPAVSAQPRPVMIDSYLPSLARVRQAADALAARATLRAKSGDTAGALADILAIESLAHHIGRDPTVIERLFAASLARLANSALSTLIATKTLTAADLQRAANSLAALPPLSPVFEAADTEERWSTLDAALVCAEGNAATFATLFDGMFAPLAQIDRDHVDWTTVLRSINALYDRQIAALRLSNPERAAASAAVQKEIQDAVVATKNGTDHPDLAWHNEPTAAYSSRVASGFIGIFMSDLARAADRVDDANDSTATLVAALGLDARSSATATAH